METISKQQLYIICIIQIRRTIGACLYIKSSTTDRYKSNAWDTALHIIILIAYIVYFPDLHSSEGLRPQLLVLHYITIWMCLLMEINTVIVYSIQTRLIVPIRLLIYGNTSRK